MYEYTKDEYIDKFKVKLFDKYKVDAERVWEVYHARVEYALDIIPRFKIGDKNITDKYVRIALGVNSAEWDAMVYTFERLQQSLRSDREFTKFKSELDLMKGIQASEHKNAKMLEMQLKLYNDDFKKSDEHEVELPKTLNITIENKQKDDNELKEYSPKEAEE